MNLCHVVAVVDCIHVLGEPVTMWTGGVQSSLMYCITRGFD